MKNQNLDALCVNDEIRIAAVFLWLLLLVGLFRPQWILCLWLCLVFSYQRAEFGLAFLGLAV